MSSLSEFFAVTVSGSLYHIHVNPEDSLDPIVEKIASSTTDGLVIGTRLSNGYKVGITNFGVLRYYPEKSHGGRITSAGMSSTSHHGGHTSMVVALFLDLESARGCMEQKSVTPWDHRWLQQSKETLAAIGHDHETFIIDEGVPNST